MNINIKELMCYSKYNKIQTINLDNLELDLCLLDGEKPTAEHIFNALDYFHDICLYEDCEDVGFISDVVSCLKDEFFGGCDIEDENLIYAVGKYNNKEYLIEINIDLSGIVYGDNPMVDADGNNVAGTFNYTIEVDGVWSKECL